MFILILYSSQNFLPIIKKAFKKDILLKKFYTMT